MSKDKSSLEMFKLGLTLALYAAVACTVLAVVNNFTKPRIEINQINKANAAMKTVMAEADSFEQVLKFPAAENGSVTIEKVYLAKKDSSVIGGVAQVSGPTYDKGTIIVGMFADGTVSGLQFLSLTDSPGFGLKANDPTFKLASGKTFYGQFTGLNAHNGFTGGETFDVISGATITSDAVGVLVAQGTNCLLKVMEAAE